MYTYRRSRNPRLETQLTCCAAYPYSADSLAASLQCIPPRKSLRNFRSQHRCPRKPRIKQSADQLVERIPSQRIAFAISHSFNTPIRCSRPRSSSVCSSGRSRSTISSHPLRIGLPERNLRQTMLYSVEPLVPGEPNLTLSARKVRLTCNAPLSKKTQTLLYEYIRKRRCKKCPCSRRNAGSKSSSQYLLQYQYQESSHGNHISKHRPDAVEIRCTA